MTRRHRIHEAELGPVYEVITNELAHISREHRGDMVPYMKHLHLFRLWWRIKEGREGKPCYPPNLTYGAINRIVTPESWSKGLNQPSFRTPGHPQLGELSLTPQTEPPAGGLLIQEES